MIAAAESGALPFLQTPTPLYAYQETMVQITLIAGTNRAGSRTLSLTKSTQRRFDALGVTTKLLDLQQLPSELLSPGAYSEKPAAFQPFAEAVLAADGLYVVSPEYNGGYPGVLKLFIDMLPFPESFEKRPVAFMGVAAGQFGNLRGIEQLQAIFGYRNAYIYPNRVFVMQVGKALGEDGELSEPKQAKRVQQQVEGYVQFVRQLRADKGTS